MKDTGNFGDDNLVAQTISTPDGSEHIVRLPFEHWDALDWLIGENFITLDEIAAMAFKAWRIDRDHDLDTTFSTALGFAIQEADVQYESWKNGFTNDNK